MRFAELELLKYGHLEGCHLRFSSPDQTDLQPGFQPDFQMVSGANEAGKSTIMAAIGDLLFGFPHSTSYDFRFDKQLLRVGARLQADGVDLICRRKKGRTGTLLDGQDRVLEEGGLKAMLAGYSSESFQRMFSLDPCAPAPGRPRHTGSPGRHRPGNLRRGFRPGRGRRPARQPGGGGPRDLDQARRRPSLLRRPAPP